jgi:hypothetical protein
MEIRKFSVVLRAAIAGDPDSVEAILSRYMPLFTMQSVVDGKLDEDLRQNILMRVIMKLPHFDPDETR